MSTPAGWYDDGSGRQRWWDGSQWSDHFAPATEPPSAPPTLTPAADMVSPATKPPPVLGFIGLGLAVVGTVLAFFPATFAFALAILFAAFVVSLIGVFKKNTAKWPSIVGMALPPVGAAAGFVVVLAVIATGLANTPSVEAGPQQPAPSPTPTFTHPDGGTYVGRPPVEEVTESIKIAIEADPSVNIYQDMPEFFPCLGEWLWESDVSDESLWLVVDGYDPLEEEYDYVQNVMLNGSLQCDPQPGATDPIPFVPFEPPTELDGRPTVDEISRGLAQSDRRNGTVGTEEAEYTCMAQFYYDSALTDEELFAVANAKPSGVATLEVGFDAQDACG